MGCAGLPACLQGPQMLLICMAKAKQIPIGVGHLQQAINFRLALAGVPAGDVMSAAGANAVQHAVATILGSIGALGTLRSQFFCWWCGCKEHACGE